MEFFEYQNMGNNDCLSKFTKSGHFKIDHNSAAKPEMACQSKRIISFKSWPGIAVKLISVVLLVSSGLFYTGNEDRLQCYMCGVLIDEWEDENDVYKQHKKISRYCKLINNFDHVGKEENKLFNTTDITQEKIENTDNISSHRNYDHTDNKINHEIVKHSGRHINITDNNSTVQLINGNLGILNESTILERRNTRTDHGSCDYTILSNRVSSFLGNWSTEMPVTVEDLSNAGLYYTGPRDKVQCAYCRGGLYNWEQGDNALVEHRKHFPQCSFVQSMSDNNTTTNTSSVITSPQGRSLVQTGQSDNDVSRSIAMSLGFSSDVIDMAIQELNSRHVDITASTLISAIHDLEDKSEDESSKEINTTSRVEESDGLNSTSSDNRKESSSNQLHKLQSENHRLKEVTRCKVCLESEVMTLFLPCRHLCCCDTCSNSVQNCPMCRTSIAATIKTFLC